MGKREDFIATAAAGGSRQDFIDLANFYKRKSMQGVHNPFKELTIFDMLQSGALPSDFYAKGGLAGIKKPLIPEAIPLVKQFRNDDPTTYLTDEDQMKGMLIATLEGQPRAVDQEILAEVDEQQNVS